MDITNNKYHPQGENHHFQSISGNDSPCVCSVCGLLPLKGSLRLDD
jgi:hypothetical protein